ncbi:MAG: hypothetical protein JWR25_1101, partial [Noviherbaspirillum sp.]|nr:hypothetical protein [Noviherbaspirillum sp.]
MSVGIRPIGAIKPSEVPRQLG